MIRDLEAKEIMDRLSAGSAYSRFAPARFIPHPFNNR
jgi:hypothetical protein